MIVSGKMKSRRFSGKNKKRPPHSGAHLLHISGISPIGLVGVDVGIDPYADLEDPAKNKR